MTTIATPAAAVDTDAFATVTPECGEIWLPLNLGNPVVVTGVIAGDDDETTVCFSNLEGEAMEAPLGWFIEGYEKR